MYRRILAAVVLLALEAAASPAFAEQQPLYRIFLRDGTSLVSYGEYARMADRVVFSLPVGALEPAPQLQMVSILESTVDWGKTEEYTESVRTRRYFETRGEHDFALLSSQVATALNDVAHSKDPAIRLAAAEEARKKLAEWPRQNYGYRAADIAQLLWLFDDVVSELRAAAGLSRYDVTLYAHTVPPAPRELLPPPDFHASIEQALTVARITKDTGERLSLLRAVAAALDPNDPAEWKAARHAEAVAELAAEERISRSYAELISRAVASASARSQQADVMGLQALIRQVLEADDRLGRLRPQETSALLTLLDTRLEDARQLRLARDAFQMRAGVLRAYRTRVDASIRHLSRASRSIEAIRELAGPAPRSLAALESRVHTAGRLLARVKPPHEAADGHAMLKTAISMAVRAAATRRKAISSGDMAVAWEASSAAAGALLMFEQAVQEINRQTSFPRLR